MKVHDKKIWKEYFDAIKSGRKEARKICRELEKKVEGEIKPFTTEERIKIRKELNKLIGIYDSN